MNTFTPNNSEILLYQTEDGHTRIEVKFKGETAWLSLNQMAELFDRDKSLISKQIGNVFEESELSENSTVAKFATVQKEGSREVYREIGIVINFIRTDYEIQHRTYRNRR
jgi:Virulence protein